MSAFQSHPDHASVSWSGRLVGLVPAVFVILYPLLLNAFHASVSAGGNSLPLKARAAITLAGAFAVPLIGLLFAWKLPDRSPMRRLSYACVAAPTLYVFMGVLSYMVKSRLPDEVIWAALWVTLSGIALVSPEPILPSSAAQGVIRWRIVHGATAAVISLFVLFHVVNHLFGLAGYRAHDEVQTLGEVIYRAPIVEPILALLLIFQTITGMRLFWRTSIRRRDFNGTFQAASGIFLAAYIIGHMDSVFVFARSYSGVATTFEWASGAPAGLIRDAWNIRLVPHYSLGVFFVLTHAALGLRAVLLEHGVALCVLNRLWLSALVASALIALLIMLAMTGTRLPGGAS